MPAGLYLRADGGSMLLFALGTAVIVAGIALSAYRELMLRYASAEPALESQPGDAGAEEVPVDAETDGGVKEDGE